MRSTSRRVSPSSSAISLLPHRGGVTEATHQAVEVVVVVRGGRRAGHGFEEVRGLGDVEAEGIEHVFLPLEGLGVDVLPGAAALGIARGAHDGRPGGSAGWSRPKAGAGPPAASAVCSATMTASRRPVTDAWRHP
jgi:hypothetical protein